MVIIKNLFLILLIFTLTACNTVKKREKQYLDIQTIKPITIPSDLSSSSIESYYPISNTQTNQQSKSISLIPPKE